MQERTKTKEKKEMSNSNSNSSINSSKRKHIHIHIQTDYIINQRQQRNIHIKKTKQRKFEKRRDFFWLKSVIVLKQWNEKGQTQNVAHTFIHSEHFKTHYFSSILTFEMDAFLLH